MEAAEDAERASRELYSRVQVIFLMKESSDEDRAHAHEILGMLTKDSCKRERTCSDLYRKVREAHPDQKDRLHKLMRQKQKRMKFTDRCMATQAHYQKKNQTHEQESAQEKEVRRSYRAHRLRQRIPEGGRFCPPRIFPHDRVPEGRPVSWPPEVYMDFKSLEPEELVFNMEHYNFELPPDFRSIIRQNIRNKENSRDPGEFRLSLVLDFSHFSGQPRADFKIKDDRNRKG